MKRFFSAVLTVACLCAAAPFASADSLDGQLDDALAYAERKGVPAPSREASLYSRDRNLWHISHEGGPLEDPTRPPEADMFIFTVMRSVKVWGSSIVNS